MTQRRIPLFYVPGKTEQDGRLYGRMVGKKGGRKVIQLPTNADIRATWPDVEAYRTWGRQAARELIGLLVKARKAQCIPASRVAEVLDVAPEIIYRLENTSRDCTLSTAIRYARAVGLDFELVETL